MTCACCATPQEQPDLYKQYHEGFRQQTQGWPRQPVDVAIAWLAAKPQRWVVADFGCGDAKIAATVKQRVHSFDLVAHAPGMALARHNTQYLP